MDKTIMVVLDACQYEAGTRNLGYLEHMIDYGLGAKYKIRGELPSLSRPMYATLLTGLPAYKHGITYNEISKKLTCPNVFGQCKAQGGVTAAAAYHWMSELYNHAPFNSLTDRYQMNCGGSIDYGIFYWQDVYPDAHLFADGDYLRCAFQPDFLLIHSMAIDLAGHIHYAGSAAYEKTIAVVSEIITSYISSWLEDGYQVVITADHGMNELGNHGGADQAQRDVPLYIFSPKVKCGRFEEDYTSQLEIAPMLCHLLGVEAADTMIKNSGIIFNDFYE